MDNQFEPLANGEVLSIDESALVLIGHRTFRVGEFAEAIRVQLEGYVTGWTKEKDAWFSEEGIPCEVLRFSSQGWQKGKVRIRLEFCQQDFEDKPQDTSASSGNPLNLAVPTSSLDDLDLDESPISSTSFDNELGTVALGTAALVDSSDELDMGELPLSSSDEDEFELGTLETSDLELEAEAPSIIYAEMAQETSTFIADDEFDTSQMQTSLDDEFDLGEISESIEQELELVEAPSASDNELIGLGEMSTDRDDDLDFGELSVGDKDDFEFGELSAGGKDDFEFGEMSTGNPEEFQFEDISLSDEFGENEPNSLLDDVWQDINEGSWQNNH